MKMSMRLLVLPVAAVLVALLSSNSVRADFSEEELDMSFGFYHQTCPDFEAIVHNTVKEWVNKDYTLAPSLMRLHFHDCAVRVGPTNFLLNFNHSAHIFRITSWDNTILRLNPT